MTPTLRPFSIISVMSATVTSESPRRSKRVFMSVPVVVSGKNLLGRKFCETCKSIVINAHGGLIYLNQELEDGVMLLVSNPVTQEELECRVVFLGDMCDRGQRVGVEFLSPSPHFWGVEFMQPDWSERHAAPPLSSVD